LPQRHNRGKPPKWYVPEDGMSREVQYPIAKNVTTERLPEKVKKFTNKMLSIEIPKNIDEARKDQRWVITMDLEMEALKRNDNWEIVELKKGTK
jgi:hypothetical protein